MKFSKLLINTLREFPADAEVPSHKLLVRASYIRKLTSGIYNYMPLMWRVLKKVENIVREEMDGSDAQEILMPIMQPRELWEESGRWGVYGKELMRFEDRHNRENCLGPTHEEVITALARDEIRSYKQLPMNLYQIQNKFRDEIRPRFGLLRGREFIMKDAYSFDVNEKGLDRSYDVMAKAYTRIFKRCGLDTKMVQSDSGAIGGSLSHEYMVLVDSNSGEDNVYYCEKCDYAGNSNWAESILPEAQSEGDFDTEKEVDTPNTRTIEELAEFLNIAPSLICKALVYIADDKPVIALIRGDRTVEETKLMNALGAQEIRIATEAEIQELMEKSGFSAKAGFISPIGLNIEKERVIADKSVACLKNFVIGVNKNDIHMVGASWGKTLELPQVKDIRLAEAGDVCPKCNDNLKISQGIEVGNIFKLGTKYSEPMKSTFMDENGKEKPFVMGCYGIGISRTAAAAVEKYHDDNGIIWPMAIAPFQVVVIPVNIKDEEQMRIAQDYYNTLKNQGYDVAFDDRKDRAGVKFKDAELIGVPLRITVGKTIQDGNVEIKVRKTNEQITVGIDKALDIVKDMIDKELES